MPKSAANFTSGGASSIRTSSGKRSALDSGRPLSSLMSAGKTTLAVTAGVNGALKARRSEEHTSELQSLMRISYAVFCLKKKRKIIKQITKTKVIITNNKKNNKK